MVIIGAWPKACPWRFAGNAYRIIAPLTALALIAALGAAGCGDGGDSDVPPGSTTAVGDAGPSPTSSTTSSVTTPTTSSATSTSIRSTTTSVQTAQPPGLPENFPPLELPDGSTVLQSRTQEVGDGRVLSETFFDAPVNAARQYEHFLRVLERAGYEILDQHLTEGERLSAYRINAARRDVAVTITGGGGAVGEQSERLATAENPFVVTVAPGGG